MTDDLVTLAVAEGIARLELNRPDAGNALNPPLGAALRAAAAQLEGRADVRAVILSGAGPAFCVGGDLGFMGDAGDEVRPALHALATDLHAAITSLQAIDAPVIAAVDGVAAGAGMSLVCGADLSIAGESARLTMAYTAAGLSPDGGSTWFLPRIVGMRKATELMLTNARLSAAEAQELGIVTRVVPDDEVRAQAGELARSIAGGPTRAYGAVKRLLRESAGAGLTEQLAAEADSIADLAISADGREGIAAFLGKRRAQFNGS